MITTQVQFSDFWGWLQSSGGYKNNFSYKGAKALFKYLDEASDNGEPNEADNYDPIAWCCEFSEYTPQELTLAIHEEHGEDGKLTYPQILEWYEDKTTVIEFDGGVIIQNF